MDTTTPNPPPPPKVPAVVPDTNAAGLSGFSSFLNDLAAYVLYAALAGAVIGLLIFVLGPAFGIQSGRRAGTFMMLTSIGVTAALAALTGLVGTIFKWFGGQSNLKLPSIVPNMDATGLDGFHKFINVLGAWAMYAALAGVILGLLVMAFGPPLGISSGRRAGTLMILGALFVAGGIAVIATIINLVYTWFA